MMNENTSTLSELLWYQRSKGQHTDVTFLCARDQSVFAHRAVLASNFPALKPTLLDGLGEDQVVIFAKDFCPGLVLKDLRKVYFEGKAGCSREFQLLSNLTRTC